MYGRYLRLSFTLVCVTTPSVSYGGGTEYMMKHVYKYIYINSSKHITKWLCYSTSSSSDNSLSILLSVSEWSESLLLQKQISHVKTPMMTNLINFLIISFGQLFAGFYLNQTIVSRYQLRGGDVKFFHLLWHWRMTRNSVPPRDH